MTYHDTKRVTNKELTVGQKINGYMDKATTRCLLADLTVKEMSPEKIVFINKFGIESETVSNPENYLFSIDLTREELLEKYKEEVNDLIAALNNKIPQLDGEHAMDNSWLYCGKTLTDIVSELRRKELRVIGYSTLQAPKVSWTGLVLDIGIIAEYDDGERIWIHSSDTYRKELLERSA